MYTRTQEIFRTGKCHILSPSLIYDRGAYERAFIVFAGCKKPIIIENSFSCFVVDVRGDSPHLLHASICAQFFLWSTSFKRICPGKAFFHLGDCNLQIFTIERRTGVWGSRNAGREPSLVTETYSRYSQSETNDLDSIGTRLYLLAEYKDAYQPCATFHIQQASIPSSKPHPLKHRRTFSTHSSHHARQGRHQHREAGMLCHLMGALDEL